jgi:FAD/FMN-containing dehydrogenase
MTPPGSRRWPGYRDVGPRAVVRCATARDVARTIAYARDSGTHVVPRGGGHCFAGRSSTEGLVLDLGRLNAITVSPDGRAVIGAGARLAQVYDVLHSWRRTVPAGCGPTVGIAGLTLGGGLGLLGRTHGLTCDALVGARVVLASGRLVDCDTGREPELFWALRGAGGGQFGVATSLVFAAVPEPRATRFDLCWPDAAAAAVVAAWQDWAPDAPDDVTANLTVVAEPGRPVRVVVFGASLRDAETTSALLDELAAGAGIRPDTHMCGGKAFRDLKRSFAGPGAHDEDAQVTTSRSEFFARPLPAAAISALLDELTGGHRRGRRELNFPRWAERTTGWPRTRPRSSTAASGSCSNTQPATTRGGWTARGRSRTPTDPAGSTRTSPTRSWTAGRAPTTAATSRAWWRSSTPTTPTGSFASRKPSDPKPLEESCLV